jgi:hypothetical protein
MGRAREPSRCLCAVGRVVHAREKAVRTAVRPATMAAFLVLGEVSETERAAGKTGIHGNHGIMLNVAVPSCIAARRGPGPAANFTSFHSHIMPNAAEYRRGMGWGNVCLVIFAG